MLILTSSFGRKLLKTVKFLSIATAGAAIAGSLPKPVQAFVLDGNTGSVQYSVEQLAIIEGSDSGGPVFNANGKLIGAGSRYPLLVGAPIGNSQVINGPISPALNAIDYLKNSEFGGANAVLLGIALPNGAAILWPSFSVVNPYAVFSSEHADVNTSSASANFINDASQPFIGTAGAFLAVSGRLGGLVEASLTGTIDGVAFQPIVIAAAAPGRGLPNFVSARTFQRFTPFSDNEGQSFFDASGVSLLPNLITVNPGQTLNIQGTLTLVTVDGGGIASGKLPSDAPVPDFGLTAAEPVPEPSSVLGTLAFGVLGLGLLLKRQLKKPKVLV